MIEKVKTSCKNLLSPDKKYIVALSGGADSTALLRLLLSLNYNVSAAHCNFHLRGDESDRDERFCKDLCERLGVTLHCAHFDTKAYAELHGVSIEMAARTLRYDYFFKLVDDLDYEGVCVAHHRDDSVETVLLNIIRGTGVDGLRGIAAKNGKVIRPLLNVSRSEIIDYMKYINQDFITDSTNLVDDVQRNKIRLNVIPELLKVNPAATVNIHKLSHRVQDALEILGVAVENAKIRVSKMSANGETLIDIKLLIAEPGAETILWSLLKDKDFSSQQAEQIYEWIVANESDSVSKSGREWTSNTYSLLIDRGKIVVSKIDSKPSKVMKVPETGTYVYSGDIKFRFARVAVDENFQISKVANRVCLDAEKVKFPLIIRTVKQGDWFIPFGMKGRKLVSDFLTDKKLSLFEKRRQIVIADSRGNIVWLVGLRPDNRFCITNDTNVSLVAEIL